MQTQEDLTPYYQLALRLDEAFTLVDLALQQDPFAEGLRQALDDVLVRRICRMVKEVLLENVR